MMKGIQQVLVVLTASAACLWVSGAPVNVSAQEYGIDDEPPPVVAVMDITQDGAGLSSSSLRRMSEYLLSRITAGGRYQVVPRDQVSRALVAQKVKAQQPCYGSCHVQLANALAAGKVIHAKFMKVGNRCSLILDLYDIQTETMEKSVESDRLSCNETGLKEGVNTAALKLSGRLPVDVTQGGGQAGSGIQAGAQSVTGTGAAVSNMGTLNISGTPDGALVEITGPAEFGKNGRASARLPVVAMRVPPGNYTVSVAAKDYETVERTVWVYPGASADLSVALEYGFGQLELTGGPAGLQGRVTCADGTPMNVALPGQGSTIRLTVPRGECRVTFAAQGHEALDRTVTVAGGGTVSVDATMQQDTKGITWVRIPGGTFRMGSNDGDDDEKPVHTVTVPTFEMAKTEVTNAQYQRCVNAGGCTAPHWDDGTCYVYDGSNWVQGTLPRTFRGDEQPVVCVDWDQASAYAKWAGGRLPTEAEWEYAARGGGREQKYPWGNAEATCAYAVMDDGGNGCGRDGTWPVCSKTAGNTSQGLCDMAGNVWEWVKDWYGSYPGGSVTNPTGPSSGSNRVSRGGSWNDYARGVRAANRNYFDPGYLSRNRYLGFRPARSVR